jgi:hypothetical protein
VARRHVRAKLPSIITSTLYLVLFRSIVSPTCNFSLPYHIMVPIFRRLPTLISAVLRLRHKAHSRPGKHTDCLSLLWEDTSSINQGAQQTGNGEQFKLKNKYVLYHSWYSERKIKSNKSRDRANCDNGIDIH